MKYGMAALVAVALVMSACASKGAGQTQDPCGLAQVQEAAPAGMTQQAASQAQGGQRASNQPVMSDPTRWTPATTWGGGAGAVSATNEWWDDRAMSGAPATTQALQANTDSEALNVSNGVHPLISSIQEEIKKTSARLDVATATGNLTLADKYREDLAGLIDKMSAAASSTAKTTNITYDYNGAYITMGVSSSSTASGRPGGASTSGDGTETSAPTAKELAERAGAPAEPDSPPNPEPVAPVVPVP